MVRQTFGPGQYARSMQQSQDTLQTQAHRIRTNGGDRPLNSAENSMQQISGGADQSVHKSTQQESDLVGRGMVGGGRGRGRGQ